VRHGLIAAAACLGLVPAAAVAQCNVTRTGSCALSRGISITINHAAELLLSSTSTTLTSPTAAVYTAGSAVDAGPTVTVKANAPWRLNVSAGSSTWTATGALANPSKPVSDLQLGTASTGPFTALSVSGFQFASGDAATAGTAVTLYYNTLWHWTSDPPGTYTETITFTITSP
jgi:hypothetical protein